MIGLFAAVECGDAKKVEQLLDAQEGAEERVSTLKLVDYRHRTVLHLAAELGHEEVVEVLLGRGGDMMDLLLAKDCGGFTALHLACELGHDKIVARLLGQRPELAFWRVSGSGLTCLHLAVIRGHFKVVQLLLATRDCSRLPIVEDFQKRPPLHFAVEYGREEIAALLNSQNNGDDDGKYTFHDTIQLFGKMTDLIDNVRSLGLFRLAAWCYHDTIVAEWCARRKQPRSIEGGDKMSLLTFAIKHGCDSIVEELLSVDNVAKKDAQGLFQLAVEEGYDKIVGQLLALRPHVIDVRGQDDETILHRARDVEVVKQLLACKPELIHAKNWDWLTALDEACSKARPQLVACLLTYGPVVNESMLWQALKYEENGDSPKNSEVVKLLCAHKPELMEKVIGSTPLHHVFGVQDNTSPPRLFSEKLMRTVWELSPPQVLHATSNEGDRTPSGKFSRGYGTPFEVAIRCDNKFAMELVRGKLSLDQILTSYAKCGKECPFLELSEPLLVALNQDVVGTVWEYLGFERLNKNNCQGLSSRGLLRDGPPNKKIRKEEEQC